MTEIQKKQIAEMRRASYSIKDIANYVGVTADTVRSYCRRNEIEPAPDICTKCGTKLQHIPHKRKKKFCSDKCRLSWWKDNRVLLRKKAVYKFICKQCGKPFESYGNNHRIYCSRKCYADARRKECKLSANKNI